MIIGGQNSLRVIEGNSKIFCLTNDHGEKNRKNIEKREQN